MSRRKVLRRMQERIREFDLCSLVHVLERIGFKRMDIYFQSSNQLISPRSLCESIHFSQDQPQVRVILNMGLLSINSPIPSYFRKLMEEEEIDSEKFANFLGFFNNLLIHEHLRLIMPEGNKHLFDNWRETHFHYLSLLGFESISTLWLLIKSSFPELIVNIIKDAQMMRLNSSTLRLGQGCLGPLSYIGERVEQTLSSFRITFTTEEEVSELGIPWPVEINHRLNDWIFPILRRTDIHLSIVLIIKHKTGQMHLDHTHYIGFDRIGYSKHPFQLLLFYGYVKNMERSRFIAE